MADDCKKRNHGLKIMDRNEKSLLEKEFHGFCRKVKEYKYVCLFGVGKKAEHWGYEFVQEWGTGNITCFSDNNPKMWGKEIIDGLRCVPPTELIQYGKDLFCVIATNEANFKQISEQLEKLGMDHVFLNHAWFRLDEVIGRCLEIKLPKAWGGKNQLGKYQKEIGSDTRIAVYTCILGHYDDLRQPAICDSRCDYYFLGFEEQKNIGIYQWIDISGKLPEGLELKDLTRINRYCKMHPHIFFPQYNYSIYVDGSIQIQTEVARLIQKIGRIGIASYGMPTADDVYEHAASLFYYCNAMGEEHGKEKMRKQLQRYIEEGFPRYFGLTENGVMVREHNNKDCIRVMETWWKEVLNNSRRDQLSFMYAVWKNGFTLQDIGYIDDTFRNGPEFKFCAGHNKEYEGTLKFNR